MKDSELKKCNDCKRETSDCFDIDFDTDNGIETKPICKKCFFENYV